MDTDSRQILEEIARDMGASRVSEMTDAELVAFLTE